MRGREAQIAEIDCIPVTLPIEAPILTSYGSLNSWARTIVRITHGHWPRRLGRRLGPREARRRLKTFEPLLRVSARGTRRHLAAHQELELLSLAEARADRRPRSRWPASTSRARRSALPLYELLGGKVRDTVPVAGYLFYRHANEAG